MRRVQPSTIDERWPSDTIKQEISNNWDPFQDILLSLSAKHRLFERKGINIRFQDHSLRGDGLQYMVSAESSCHNIYNLYTLLLIYIKIIDKYHYICIISCNFIESYVTNRNWRQLE